MNKSESISELTKALVKVQSQLKPAAKNAQNPFFHNQYADLNSVWDSCRTLLAENGLAVAQVNSVGLENTVIIETVLMHSSGEWLSGELMLPLAKLDPQGVGSAITYGRRYGLAAVLGIVADADDDANQASGRQNGNSDSTRQPTPPIQQAAPSESRSTSNPNVATTLADMLTTKQLGMIKAVAREAGIDYDEECQSAMNCMVTELTRRAASSFIDRLRQLQESQTPLRRAN